MLYPSYGIRIAYMLYLFFQLNTSLAQHTCFIYLAALRCIHALSTLTALLSIHALSILQFCWAYMLYPAYRIHVAYMLYLLHLTFFIAVGNGISAPQALSRACRRHAKACLPACCEPTLERQWHRTWFCVWVARVLAFLLVQLRAHYIWAKRSIHKRTYWPF